MDLFDFSNPNESITLYFVQDVGSNNKEMRNAYSVCQDAKLKINVVSEDEVEDLPTRMNCVFVLEEFKGKTFMFLASKDCLVVGPRCLSSCVSKRIPIPDNQSPVFNLAMNGLVICASKLKRSKKEELATIVGYMGGRYSDQLTLAVTHLISDGSRSVKCENAFKHKIPVMSCSWVKAIWEASFSGDVTANDAELFEKHRMPIFKGVHITCSNLAQSVKVKLQKIIEKNGGVYMPSLEQNKTTVLVIGDPEDGKKFQHAQLWGIPCVKPNWIHESMDKQYLMPYKDHIVVARPTCSTPTSDLPSFMSNDVSVVPIGNASHVEINETNNSLNSIASVRTVPKNKVNAETNKSYKKYLEQLNMADVSSAGLFLDGCKIYLSGFVMQEVDKLKKVLNMGGATIFTTISDSVSHIIVGDFNLDDAKAISQCSQRPHVVNVEWLLASIKSGGVAPVQKYLSLQPAAGQGVNVYPPQLSSPLGSKGVELLKKPHLENPANGMTTPIAIDKPSTSRKLFVKSYKPNRSVNQSVTSERPTSIGDKRNSTESDDEALKNIATPVVAVKEKELSEAANKAQNSSFNAGEEPPRSNESAKEQEKTSSASDLNTICQEPFFQGLLFVIVGFEDATQIMEPIETLAGCVVNASQFQGVPDYAVVPFDGTPEKFSAMETVTVLWIEDCWEQRKVVPVEYYHQPITMKEGYKPLEGVTLCVTGFVGKERSFIGHVATTLGAIVQDSFSRKNHPDKNILRSTHLVCKSPQGSKYTAAKKWGLPTVNKDWLIACAAAGIKVLEGKYSVPADGAAVANAPITGSPKTSMEPSVVKQLKTSSDRTSPGLPATIVERTPMERNVKCMVDKIEPIPKKIIPPTAIGNVSAANLELIEIEKDILKLTESTVVKESMKNVVEHNERDQNKENKIREDVNEDSLQTPVVLKSRRVSRLQLNESISEQKHLEFLTPNERGKISNPSSVGPSPGHMDTPDTPYGQVLTGCTPSPTTKKRWKKWIDNLPDLYEGSPILARQRRPSTPLNVLMKQLWVKFGGVEIDGIQSITGDLLPNGPYATWALDKSHNDVELEDGELMIKGTNISSANISLPNTQLSQIKTTSQNEISRTYSRRNADINNSDNESKEISPSQSRGVSERLSKRIEEVKEVVSRKKSMEVYDFKLEGVRGEKRKSEEDKDYSVDQDWDWTPLPGDEQLVTPSKRSGKSDARPGGSKAKKRYSFRRENGRNDNGQGKDDESGTRDIIESEEKTKDDLVKVDAAVAEEEDEEEVEENEEVDEEEEDVSRKEKRVFVLSNVPNPRDKYESIIKNLGGETNSSACYDPVTTHLIIDKPVRSEKLLCCMASGKWVLHISYLTSCYQARTFLPEEDYEWGNERSKDRLPTLHFGSQEYELAMSAHRWRVQRTEFGKVGAYSKFKAVLLTSEQKAAQYSRLLIAGGATLLEKSQIKEATHVFWDEHKMELPVSKQLLKNKKILLLKPLYLGDYLIKVQPPKPLPYIIK